MQADSPNSNDSETNNLTHLHLQQSTSSSSVQSINLEKFNDALSRSTSSKQYQTSSPTTTTTDIIYNSPPSKAHQSPHNLQDIIEEEKDGSDSNLDQLSLVATYHSKYSIKKRRNFFTGGSSQSPIFAVKLAGNKRIKNKFRSRSVTSSKVASGAVPSVTGPPIEVSSESVTVGVVNPSSEVECELQLNSCGNSASNSPAAKMQAEQGSIGDLHKYHNRYLRNRRHTLANVR